MWAMRRCPPATRNSAIRRPPAEVVRGDLDRPRVVLAAVEGHHGMPQPSQRVVRSLLMATEAVDDAVHLIVESSRTTSSVLAASLSP
jgi:hypothetical protein